MACVTQFDLHKKTNQPDQEARVETHDHRWMVDVLSDLRTYAADNNLMQTAQEFKAAQVALMFEIADRATSEEAVHP